MASADIPFRQPLRSPGYAHPIHATFIASVTGLFGGWALMAVLQLLNPPLPISPFKVLLTGFAEMLGSPPLWRLSWVGLGPVYDGLLATFAIFMIVFAAPVFARMTGRSVLWSMLLAVPLTGIAANLGVYLARETGEFGTAVLYGTAGRTVVPCLVGFAVGLASIVIVRPRKIEEKDGVHRGTRLKARETARKRLGKKAPATALEIALATKAVAFADTVLPREAEPKHAALCGVTGSGKSTAAASLMRTAIARGDRMIVADPGGENLSRFWQPGDTILNPFDARSAKWDLFAEISEDTDYDRFAEALLPLSGAPENDHWVEEGRTLLSCLMRSYHETDLGSSDDFAQVLTSAPIEQLAGLCEDTAAARLFEEGNERLRGSVLSKLKPAVKLLGRVAKTEGRTFSIREWVQSGTGRLWLPYRINQLASLRAMFGTWMGVATLEALSLPEDRERRLWFLIDELDVLGRVPDLEVGLTNGRRFGACFVIGFQSIAQLERAYGAQIGRTIIENCSTKLILRCEASEGGGTAEYASALIGDREGAYEVVTTSASSSENYGGESGGSSSTSGYTRSVDYRIERAVLPSEITQLADREGYLRLAGGRVWEKVEFPYEAYPIVTEAMVPARSVTVVGRQRAAVGAGGQRAIVRP